MEHHHHHQQQQQRQQWRMLVINDNGDDDDGVYFFCSASRFGSLSRWAVGDEEEGLEGDDGSGRTREGVACGGPGPMSMMNQLASRDAAITIEGGGDDYSSRNARTINTVQYSHQRSRGGEGFKHTTGNTIATLLYPCSCSHLFFSRSSLIPCCN